jgi:hypothetical protein
LQGVGFDEFVEVLESLNFRDIKYLVSYDGRTGERVHGRKLPERLRLHLIELHAGRSSQATLLGRDEVTVESLYLSPALADSLRLRRGRTCDWAFPDNYGHVAMREARRADIRWTGAEVESYERLKKRTLELQKNIPGYVKEIVEQHLSRQRGR